MIRRVGSYEIALGWTDRKTQRRVIGVDWENLSGGRVWYVGVAQYAFFAGYWGPMAP